MELKIRGSAFTLLNELLSLVLAASIVILSVAVVSIGCFRSDSIKKDKLQAHAPQTIECVNAKLEELANSTGFPVEAYTNCFDENLASLIYDKIINNINYAYPTSFSDDEEIYRMFKTNITDYCYDNGIDVSSQNISIYSSLAVDAVNEALGGYSTSSVGITKLVKNRIMIVLIVVPVVFIVACLVLIDLLNKGRHRRLNFYGMGISIAGALMALVSLFVILKNYAQAYQFCENAIYDAAIGDIMNLELKILSTIGIVCLIVGFVLLINNYFYFKKKKIEQNEHREQKMQMKTDYMLEYEENKSKETDEENITE